jgi:hydrogenase nickel incorporation protein HypB
VRALLAAKRVLMVNIIGSPGCGKTTILEKTLAALAGRLRIAVIEGDVATDRDARRLQKYDVPIVLINTDGACHLESASILKALAEFDLTKTDIVCVENVGNLVCPAEFDIGEHAKIAVSSVTEGEDKPEKYPLLFQEAKLLLVNKMDLAPHTGFDRAAFVASVRKVNGELPMMEMSSRTGAGLEPWYGWLQERLAGVRA